jgi:hypothetical protein
MRIYLSVLAKVRPCLLRLPLTFICALALAGAHSALALEFEFVNKGAIPLSYDEMRATEDAAALWTRGFRDPITVKINVEWRKDTFFASEAILASVQIGRTTAPLVMVRDS